MFPARILLAVGAIVRPADRTADSSCKGSRPSTLRAVALAPAQTVRRSPRVSFA
jgi:hypothetical protein